MTDHCEEIIESVAAKCDEAFGHHHPSLKRGFDWTAQNGVKECHHHYGSLLSNHGIGHLLVFDLLWMFLNAEFMLSVAVACQRSLFTFLLNDKNGDLFKIRTLLKIYISPDDDETHFFSNYACIPLVQVAAAIRHWYALEKNSDHMWWMCVISGNVGSHKEMWGGTIQDE